VNIVYQTMFYTASIHTLQTLFNWSLNNLLNVFPSYHLSSPKLQTSFEILI